MESASSGDLAFSALPEFPLDAGDGGHPHRATYATALHWTSLVGQTVKNLPAMWETWLGSLSQEDSPGEGNSNPLQNSCLKNPMDRGARRATDHGVTTSRTRLSDFHILSFITLDAKDWFMRISEQVGWSVWNGMWWAEYFWVINVRVHDVLSGPNKGFLFNDKGMAFASVFIGCVVF